MKFEFGGVLVRKRGKTLLVREKHKAAKNLWSLPLGFVEKKESLEEGTIREAREESGYDVRLIKKVKSIIVKAKEFRSAHPFLRGKYALRYFTQKSSGSGRKICSQSRVVFKQGN